MLEKKPSATNIIVLVLLGAALYLSAAKIFAIVLPFAIAYILSKLTEPLMRFLHSHVRFPSWLSALLCTLLVVIGFVFIVAMIGTAAYQQLHNLYENWDSIASSVEKGYQSLSGSTNLFYDGLPEDLKNLFADLPDVLDTYLKQITTPLFELVKNIVTNIVGFVPQFALGMIVTFLACYFLSRDRDVIRRSAGKILGSRNAHRLSSLINQIKGAAGGYIKTQLTLMAIVFAILSVGLGIAGVDYFILIAFAISLLDALPLFGSGMVLVPWAVFMLLRGRIGIGITLAALYLTIVLSRQILEPKILGKHIGIHPLITLAAMYTGLKLFGIFGMIIGPVIAVIVKNLYAAGIFKNLKGTS